MIKPWTKKSGKVEPSGDSELEMTGEDNVASPKSNIKVMAGFPMTSEAGEPSHRIQAVK